MLCFRHKLILPLEVVREVGKNLRKGPRFLSGADHGDVEFRKHRRMPRERSGNGVPTLNIIDDFPERPAQNFRLGFGGKEFERIEHRNLCIKERGNLARENDDFFHLNALKNAN